jgi:hypothetical protein
MGNSEILQITTMSALKKNESGENVWHIGSLFYYKLFLDEPCVCVCRDLDLGDRAVLDNSIT